MGRARPDIRKSGNDGARLPASVPMHNHGADRRVRSRQRIVEARMSRLGALNPRPLVTLVVAIAGFAFSAERFGFVVATIWLLIIGSLADPESQMEGNFHLHRGSDIARRASFRLRTRRSDAYLALLTDFISDRKSNVIP